MGLRDYGDDDSGREEDGRKKLFKDFDCPSCDANNPYDDGFMSGDEIRCYYCGLSFKVHVTEDGRVKFKEI